MCEGTEPLAAIWKLQEGRKKAPVRGLHARGLADDGAGDGI